MMLKFKFSPFLLWMCTTRSGPHRTRSGAASRPRGVFLSGTWSTARVFCNLFSGCVARFFLLAPPFEFVVVYALRFDLTGESEGKELAIVLWLLKVLRRKRYRLIRHFSKIYWVDVRYRYSEWREIDKIDSEREREREKFWRVRKRKIYTEMETREEAAVFLYLRHFSASQTSLHFPSLFFELWQQNGKTNTFDCAVSHNVLKRTEGRCDLFCIAGRPVSAKKRPAGTFLQQIGHCFPFEQR